MIDNLNSPSPSPIEKILPQKIWQIERVLGSVMSFQMGEKVARKTKTRGDILVGSICLTIYLCDWDFVDKNGNFLMNSDDVDQENFNTPFSALIGKSLLSIERVEDDFLLVKFDEGYCIELYEGAETYEKEDDLFMFYSSGNQVCCYSVLNGFYEAD